MSEFKGTPGPWRVKESPFEVLNTDHGYLTHEVVAGNILIAALYGPDDENAKLITAAPELLELLIEADKRVIWEFHLDEEFQGRVEAAIAKALGKS